MNQFFKKSMIAFTIGLWAGSSFASMRGKELRPAAVNLNRKPASIELSEARPIASREIVNSGDAVYAQTETFAVHSDLVPRVNSEMVHLGLEEDVDFAWINRVGIRNVNFVCYSTECTTWAKRQLRTLAKAPHYREAVDYTSAWKDQEIESKPKARELTEDEKIKQRHVLHYQRIKQS